MSSELYDDRPWSTSFGGVSGGDAMAPIEILLRDFNRELRADEVDDDRISVFPSFLLDSVQPQAVSPGVLLLFLYLVPDSG